MTEKDIENLSPDQLVSGYSRSPIAMCVLFAIAFHVVVIGATSVGTILRWTGLRASAPDQKSGPAEPDRAPSPSATRPAGPTTRSKAPSAAAKGKRADRKVPKGLSETQSAPKNPDDDPTNKLPDDLSAP